MKPYYQDDLVTLYHADSFEVMKSMSNDSVDCVITDPPYCEEVHTKARANTPDGIREGVHFDSFDLLKLHKAFDEMARLSKTWTVSTLAFEHAFEFTHNPPNNAVLKRMGIWVKNNPMPQISGDRPAHGWESIVYLHKVGGKSVWNGGGNHGNYVTNIATPTGHPTPKPLSMISSFVERFSNPGETIFDPFAGGGTTLLAARNLGRKAVGVELEEQYCELIAKRLSQQSFDFSTLDN